jgi:hypothetical protein
MTKNTRCWQPYGLQASLPKDEAGLRVINLKTWNKAHLVKHLHKFFNKGEIPWYSLFWENTNGMVNYLVTKKKRLLLVARYSQAVGFI